MSDVLSAVAQRLNISISDRWYDMVSDSTEPEETPETIKQKILEEFRRIGGEG